MALKSSAKFNQFIKMEYSIFVFALHFSAELLSPCNEGPPSNLGRNHYNLTLPLGSLN